jgi:hypothetical protein
VSHHKSFESALMPSHTRLLTCGRLRSARWGHPRLENQGQLCYKFFHRRLHDHPGFNLLRNISQRCQGPFRRRPLRGWQAYSREYHSWPSFWHEMENHQGSIARNFTPRVFRCRPHRGQLCRNYPVRRITVKSTLSTFCWRLHRGWTEHCRHQSVRRSSGTG